MGILHCCGHVSKTLPSLFCIDGDTVMGTDEEVDSILKRGKLKQASIKSLSNISNIRDGVSSRHSNTEKRVENTTRSGVFLTKFGVFG